MSHRTLFALLLFCIYPSALSAGVTVGGTLPDMQIESLGELLLEGDEIRYRPWQTPGALGKVHVFQYMAGRRSARERTRPFTDRLEAEIPEGSLHFTSVINLDDALWGTTGFVKSEVESNKRKYPRSTLVLDEDGVGRSALDLPEQVAVTVVIDAGGTVLYIKEGAMSEDEIETTLDLIRGQLPEGLADGS